jgi:hypothetical protein
MHRTPPIWSGCTVMRVNAVVGCSVFSVLVQADRNYTRLTFARRGPAAGSWLGVLLRVEVDDPAMAPERGQLALLEWAG